MKNRFLLSALAVGILATGAVQAQTGHTGHTGDSMDHSARAKALFNQLDSNKDGQLSADELGRMHQAMQQQMFAKADTNGDGKIDENEFKAHAMQRAGQRAEHLFAHMDKNKDGVISPDEMKSPRHDKHGNTHHGDQASNSDHKRPTPDDMLKKMDTDGNGSLSLSEWQAASAQWHQHRHDMKTNSPDSNQS